MKHCFILNKRMKQRFSVRFTARNLHAT